MSQALMRGSCPTLREPMPTGDGLLVRLRPLGPIPLEALIGLCEAALAHGNGTIEVSARGSLQMRGFTPSSARLFAGAVEALDFEPCGNVPIIAGTLPDDPFALIDADALAAGLARAIEAKSLRLAPKASVLIDGGGRLHLDALSADIRVCAVATDRGPTLQVALAGDAATAQPLGTIALDAALPTMLRLLQRIAALGPEARAADLLAQEEIDVLCSAMDIEPATALLPSRPCAQPIGQHKLRDDGLAFGFGLAFGHTQASVLIALAEAATTNGARWARPAPDRVLLIGPFNKASIAEAARLGFIVEARDPRRRVVACPGAPACASGLIAAREIAAELAQHLPLRGDGVALHVSGCAKSCAFAAAAPLTIVGTERGCGIVRHGTARAAPIAYRDPADLHTEIERFTEACEAVHA